MHQKLLVSIFTAIAALTLLFTTNSYAENPRLPNKEELTSLRDELTTLSELGNLQASAKLGALYLSGSLGIPDYKKARKYLKIGKQSNLSAQLAYAHMLMNGMGGELNAITAEEEFSKAADKGSLEGLYMSAKLTLGRNATEAEIKKAIQGMIKASREGFPPAISTVGELFRTGTFLPKDPDKALQHFTVSAEKGYFEAYIYAAEMHLFSELSGTNIPEAKRLYRIAASKGVKSANYPLAFLLYNTPNASEDDFNEAFRLVETASYAWDERCQYLLGLMYFEGKGPEKSSEQAYFWLDLAASSGVYEAHHIRALAQQKLKPETIIEVKARAKEWFNTNHSTPHKHLFIDNSKHLYR